MPCPWDESHIWEENIHHTWSEEYVLGCPCVFSLWQPTVYFHKHSPKWMRHKILGNWRHHCVLQCCSQRCRASERQDYTGTWLWIPLKLQLFQNEVSQPTICPRGKAWCSRCRYVDASPMRHQSPVHHQFCWFCGLITTSSISELKFQLIALYMSRFRCLW